MNIIKDHVAGIEMTAVPTHLKYLKCDGCGATFDAKPLGSGVDVLIDQARGAGWIAVARHNSDDLCPSCVKRSYHLVFDLKDAP